MQWPRLVLGVVLMLSHAGAITGYATESDVIGLWRTEGGDGLIEIRKAGASYEGYIASTSSPGEADRLDVHNPDPALRTRPFSGLKIMYGFVYDGKQRWSDGRIYDPTSGKTYRCNMELADRNTLKVRGYLGFSLLGQTQVWTREQQAEDTTAAQLQAPDQ